MSIESPEEQNDYNYNRSATSSPSNTAYTDLENNGGHAGIQNHSNGNINNNGGSILNQSKMYKCKQCVFICVISVLFTSSPKSCSNVQSVTLSPSTSIISNIIYAITWVLNLTNALSASTHASICPC